MRLPLHVIRVIMSNVNIDSKLAFGIVPKPLSSTFVLDIPQIQIEQIYGWRYTSMSDIYYVRLRISENKIYEIRREFRFEECFQGKIGVRGEYHEASSHYNHHKGGGVFINDVNYFETIADPYYIMTKTDMLRFERSIVSCGM